MSPVRLTGSVSGCALFALAAAAADEDEEEGVGGMGDIAAAFLTQLSNM